jgi:cytidylate kinase
MIIAIDGPAASGKGTIARMVGQQFGLPVLDTGLLYRAVARDTAARGRPLDDAVAAADAARRLDPNSLDDPALRGAKAGEAASMVGRIPQVRTALLQLQRDFAGQKGGAVLDGRDIGTVVCPDAEVKIYVTATPEVRAERRWRELMQRGEEVAHEAVLADIRERDARDAGRSSAPMKPASDAHILDTTTLDIAGAVAAAVALIEERMSGA